MSKQEEQESGKGFKVTDRRSFTADGQRREDADVDAPEESEMGRAAETPEIRAEPRGRASAAPRERPAGDIGFLELLSLLATQASIGLGGRHPVTGEPHEDLETARAMISMIEVLKEKTAGNLAPDEEQALDDVLYQLRMHFVKKAKGNR